jgi:hypothetical protein
MMDLGIRRFSCEQPMLDLLWSLGAAGERDCVSIY